jgi:hypothetical protein
MPGGKLDDAKQVLNSLDLARLQYLANQAEARCNQPGLDHAEVDRLQAQILAWRKEYLDRTKASQDTRQPP